MDDNSYACSNGVTKGEKLSVTWSGENIVIQDGDETKELVYQNGYYISDLGNDTVYYYHEVDVLSTDENYCMYKTIFSLSSYGGKWEASNLANDATELDGIPAMAFNQWQFFEDGSCTFYLNGEAVEYDTYSFKDGSSTHFL